MIPECPRGWSCVFEEVPLPEPQHVGPWWEGSWGTVVGLGAIVAVVIMLWIVGYYVHEGRRHKRELAENQRKRQHELDMAEQATMQQEMELKSQVTQRMRETSMRRGWPDGERR